jgi:hypothetical protein
MCDQAPADRAMYDDPIIDDDRNLAFRHANPVQPRRAPSVFQSRELKIRRITSSIGGRSSIASGKQR